MWLTLNTQEGCSSREKRTVWKRFHWVIIGIERGLRGSERELVRLGFERRPEQETQGLKEVGFDKEIERGFEETFWFSV